MHTVIFKKLEMENFLLRFWWWHCSSLLYPTHSPSEGHQGVTIGSHGLELDRKYHFNNRAAALCVRLWRGYRSSLLDIPFPLCFELQSALLKEFPRLMSSFQNHAGFPLPKDKAKEGSMPSVVSVLSSTDRVITQKLGNKMTHESFLLNFNCITKSQLAFSAARSEPEWFSFFWQSMVLFSCNVDCKSPLI